MINSRIFISYSHRGNGQKWKSNLINALNLFDKHHLIDVWQDGKLRISSFWDDDIKQAMGSASLAIILLTKEALESDYIINTEFPFLRERQSLGKMTIFPVVCEECDWRKIDWLCATQASNESNPISFLSQIEQERIFHKLAIDIAEELSHFALSKLPGSEKHLTNAKIYLDKFPLTRGPGFREEKLIGREQEIGLLDLAFAQHQTSIVSLVAWGGVGKTMLVQKWLQRLQNECWFGMKKVYAWSFFSQGTNEDRHASEDLFLSHALDWFGVQYESTLSAWDKGRLLCEAIDQEPTLLILDGIEPLQYPPGPMGGQLRAPGVQSLLKHLALNKNNIGHNGLCLVTTREPLTDLIDFERQPEAAWGRLLRINLGNLSAEAGAALLHLSGAKCAGDVEIKSNDIELIKASREVDGHALTLKLLGRFLARAYSGDIRKRDLVNFKEADCEEQGGTTFKMLSIFENWFANEGEIEARALSILRLLGLFDRPADQGCMTSLRKSPAIEGMTEPLFTYKYEITSRQTNEVPLSDKAWNDATHFLSDFGLILIQNNYNTERLFDCHPLIREYFAKQLIKTNMASWMNANKRLYEYFILSTEFQPNTIEGLQPLYQAVRHGCQAGIHQKVWDEIYSKRILRIPEYYPWHVLGIYGDEISVQAHFFDTLWTQPSTLLSEPIQTMLLNNIGFCLQTNGRLIEAVEGMRISTQTNVEKQRWGDAAVAANNLSEIELTLGNIVDAIHDARFSVMYADKHKFPFFKTRMRASLANALFNFGLREESHTYYIEAEEIQKKYMPEIPFLYSLMGARYFDLQLWETERASWQYLLKFDSQIFENNKLLKTCFDINGMMNKILAWRQPEDQLIEIASDFLSIGKVALFASILGIDKARYEARIFLNEAVVFFHKSGQQQEIPHGLLYRSWIRFIDGDKSGSLADLEEAWQITSRSSMRLHMADIHLFRARMFEDKNELENARKLIEKCCYWRRKDELEDALKSIQA